jgi:hypothetical protein
VVLIIPSCFPFGTTAFSVDSEYIGLMNVRK